MFGTLIFFTKEKSVSKKTKIADNESNPIIEAKSLTWKVGRERVRE